MASWKIIHVIFNFEHGDLYKCTIFEPIGLPSRFIYEITINLRIAFAVENGLPVKLLVLLQMVAMRSCDLHLACSAQPRARGRRRADCDNTDPAAASSQHINCNNTSLTQWKAKPRNIKSIRFLPFLPLLGSFFVGSTIFKKIFGRYFLVCLNCCRRPCTTPSPGHQRSQM